MTIGNTYKSFTIFLSSPGDVAIERERARQIVDSVNKTIRDLLHINFHIVSWEGLPPETPNPDEGTIQDQLNKIVERSHIFLLILYKRYGTVESGYKKSNTERELDTILAKHRLNPKISIISYFKALEENRDPGDQEQRVRDMRTRLQKEGLFFKEFTNFEDFSEKLTHDLYSLALKLRLSPYKAQCLSHFWNISGGRNPAGVDLAILYRPMNLDQIAQHPTRPHWHDRLMPAVSFEDAKAIQKVQKILRMQGLRSKVFRSAEIPPNIASLNRLWICAPRIPKAEEMLKNYGGKVRFSFEKRKGKEAILWWKDSSGDTFKIKSPLSKYLKLQRPANLARTEWNAALSRIVAKDFAIVARFGEASDDSTVDFLIAGIRGLGTWGAAWFLDRRYKALQALRGDRDIQFLLEVTYKDGMIADVRDVSNQGAEYFKIQTTDRLIKQVISEAMQGGPIR